MRFETTQRLFGILVVLFVMVLLHPSNGWTQYTIFHNFAGPPTDGMEPSGSLAYDSTRLYGMTYRGGANACGEGTGCGVIFKTKKDGTLFSVLHSFGEVVLPDDGILPYGNLILVGSTLYGMTPYGGGANNGTIFKINTDGSGYIILHSFGDGTVAKDGASPYGSLTRVGSTLYGMTTVGGAGSGVIFKINTNGSGYSVLHSFGTVTNDGATPYGTLTLVGSSLYGMTNGGGAGYGTIFKIDADGGGYTILHSFGDGAVANDGSSPWGDLTSAGSALYGMTSGGGDAANGAIFKINTNGSGYTILHSFGDGTVANDGATPLGSLTLVDSNLFGMTAGGGANYGVIFAIRTNGLGYGILHSFGDGTTANDGTNPLGSLTMIGNNVYGMTSNGGSVDGQNPSDYGTVFSMVVRVPTKPGAPTDVAATAGDAQATVTFTPPASDGGSPITSYKVTSYPGNITKTGPSSPITVTGLTSGTTYSFTVQATNAVGTGASSRQSNRVTPSSITIVSPNGGETWQPGTRQTISWNYAGHPGTSVTIQLLVGGSSSVIKADTSTGTRGFGSYSWMIPPDQLAGNNYKVRITSTTMPIFSSTSIGTFSIE